MIVGSLAIVALMGVVVTIILRGSVDTVRTEATTVLTSANDFLGAAKRGNAELLNSSSAKVSEAAHQIQGELSSPLWELASHIPFVGSDVKSMRIMADVLIDISDNALKPMAESGRVLELADFTDEGTINVEALPGIIVAIEQASPALSRSAEKISALPPAHVPQVAEILESAQEKVVVVDDLIKRMRPIFPYLPTLLGTGGQQRNYLVIAENTAEIHSIGGFVGALGVVTVTDGHIEMGDFRNLKDVLSYDDVSAGATEEEIQNFDPRCDTHHGDHNVIPDFQRVGELYFNIWKHYQHQEIDGVFGLDPVFLQYLLETTGKVDTSFGVSVDETNAASILVNKCLFWWKPSKCDNFYREVASKVLTDMLGDLDGLDMTGFFGAISKAANEDRCLIWMRDEGVEDALKEARLAGELTHDPNAPLTGVFISDASVSKMSYYLSIDTEVGEQRINEDGTRSYDMRVLIRNNFDPSAYESIPKYILVQNMGRDEYDLGEQLHLIAPEGGRIESLMVERIDTHGGEPGDSDWLEGSYQGLQVWNKTLRIGSQESVVLTYTVVTAPGATGTLSVRKTPVMPPQIAYWNESA
ncbi:MAG: DUF4012 domain-containing protein [Atopobiaceae bacterium]|nr:DUF4012 domain-containing protein [Atopobiaceae bacterium]